MLKKIASILLIVLVMNLVTVAFAATKTEKEVRSTETAKSEIANFGTG